ncbi:Uncharacterised protein [Legionella donaldsonii]|uniref:Uncharacterized protein n=1 Tax=Legionella donaldsonii TaxID=45060 RepID=A0A378J9K7_9GAMM|nr:hypothetical protein [Legionella donaldsonii]STX44493.1 Uncharacterised protein [Legionella donaldsonii]
MFTSLKKIKEFVHYAPCPVHDAVCLIYGFDPGILVVKNSNNYREVRFREDVIEFEVLFKILRGNRPFWDVRDNIFYFVDKALQNNISVDKKLLKAISTFTGNLINEDVGLFKRHYPYLSRKTIPEKQNLTTTPKITPEQRIQKWREIACEKWKQNPKIKKEEMAKVIYEELEQTKPEFLKQGNGDFVAISTIIKNLKKK